MFLHSEVHPLTEDECDGSVKRDRARCFFKESHHDQLCRIETIMFNGKLIESRNVLNEDSRKVNTTEHAGVTDGGVLL